MNENYCENQQSAIHKLKRTAFYTKTSKLTHSDPKLKKAVDYMAGKIINFKIIEEATSSWLLMKNKIPHWGPYAGRMKKLYFSWDISYAYWTNRYL